MGRCRDRPQGGRQESAPRRSIAARRTIRSALGVGKLSGPGVGKLGATMAKSLKTLAGATGPHPAAFGVTGRRSGVGSPTKTTNDSTPRADNSGTKACDSTPRVAGVETFSRARTATLL